MKAPAISVLLPVYNAAPYLQPALTSLSAQTWEDFEVIAIDDGSTDASLDILRAHQQLDPRLLVLSRANTGIVGALNEALGAARAPFLARMDADDVSEPQRFARQRAALNADSSLVALGSAVTFIDERGRCVQACPRPLAHREIEERLLAGDGGAIIHPSAMFRTNLVRALGGYRPSAQYLEDLDLYLRLGLVGNLGNLAEPLLRYRIHNTSINFTQSHRRLEIKSTIMREAYYARGLTYAPVTAPEPPPGHGDSLVHAQEWAITALQFGSRRVAVAHGVRAIQLAPRDRQSWRALKYALTAPVSVTPTC